MDKQYDKKLGSAESPNPHRFTQNDTKKISNWKTPCHGFWF